PNTEFPCYIAGHTLVRCTAHQMQRFLHLAVGENIEKRRLSELHSPSLLQGPVKYRIAARVVEVGQHNGVFLAQLVRLVEVKESACGNQCENYGTGNRNLP